MMGWQPSFVTALALLIFGFACMSAALFSIAYSFVPAHVAIRSWEFLRYLSAHNLLFIWLFAFAFAGFLTWQSVTIYSYQTERWPRLSRSQIVRLKKRLNIDGPHTLAVTCANLTDACALAHDFDRAFPLKIWTPRAKVVPTIEGEIAGIAVYAKNDQLNDPSVNLAIKAIEDITGFDVSKHKHGDVVPDYWNTRVDVEIAVGSKPSD